MSSHPGRICRRALTQHSHLKPRAVASRCRRACGECDAIKRECPDAHPGCGEAAARGECADGVHDEFMLRECQWSCGTCAARGVHSGLGENYLDVTNAAAAVFSFLPEGSGYVLLHTSAAPPSAPGVPAAQTNTRSGSCRPSNSQIGPDIRIPLQTCIENCDATPACYGALIEY